VDTRLLPAIRQRIAAGTWSDRGAFAAWLVSPQLWPRYVALMQAEGFSADEVHRVRRTVERMAAAGEPAGDLGSLAEAMRRFAAELA
jgi:hypothetical protein